MFWAIFVFLVSTCSDALCAGVERLGCLPGGRRWFPAASAQMSSGGGAIAGVAGLIWSGIRGAADVLSRALLVLLFFFLSRVGGSFCFSVHVAHGAHWSDIVVQIAEH